MSNISLRRVHIKQMTFTQLFIQGFLLKIVKNIYIYIYIMIFSKSAIERY